MFWWSQAGSTIFWPLYSRSFTWVLRRSNDHIRHWCDQFVLRPNGLNPTNPASAAVNDLRSDLTPTSSKEAVITTTLAPGAYTAIVQGVNQSEGIGIVEVFEVDWLNSRRTCASSRARGSRCV